MSPSSTRRNCCRRGGGNDWALGLSCQALSSDMKNQYFGDKRDLFKYDLWLEVAERVRARIHTYVPMLTPPDRRPNEGRRFPADAGRYRRTVFDFLKRCRDPNKRNITQLREFFRNQSLSYYGYRDNESEYFAHESRNEYFTNIPPDSLDDAVILIDPDRGLETRTNYWTKKEHRDKYVTCQNVADVAGRSSGKSVIVLFQFLQPDATKRVGDLREREQRLRDALCSVRTAWQPIPWVAEAQKSRDGHQVPRELAFFVIGVGPETAKAVNPIIQMYAQRCGLRYCLGDTN